MAKRFCKAIDSNILPPKRLMRIAAPTPPIPDLVRDSNLQTSFHLDCTIHSYTEFDRTRRRTIRQEYWKSKRRLGQGSYGQVWLEECTEGKSQGALRAVKIIHKAPDTNTRDYLRELEAVAKFSHPRVSLDHMSLNVAELSEKKIIV